MIFVMVVFGRCNDDKALHNCRAFFAGVKSILRTNEFRGFYFYSIISLST